MLSIARTIRPVLHLRPATCGTMVSSLSTVCPEGHAAREQPIMVRTEEESKKFSSAKLSARFSSTTAGSQGKQSARDRIHSLVTDPKKPVFVFMKGVPSQPACGYSNAVVQILDAYNVDYNSFNVLDDDEIRQEVKAYSSWPTIPQVYVRGTFVGGCDALIQMHQSDELEQLFTNKPTEDKPDEGEKA